MKMSLLILALVALLLLTTTKATISAAVSPEMTFLPSSTTFDSLKRREGLISEASLCPKSWPEGEPKRRRVLRTKNTPDLPYCGLDRTFVYVANDAKGIRKFLLNPLATSDEAADRKAGRPPRAGREVIILNYIEPSPNATLVNGVHYYHDVENRIHQYFYPNTTWTTGRNILNDLVLELEKKNGCLFPYIIAMDGDVQFTVNEFEHHLLMYEPAVGFIPIHFARGELSIKVPQCQHYSDAYLNAFHRTTFDFIFPYDARGDAYSWWSSQAQMICRWRYLFPLHTYSFPAPLDAKSTESTSGGKGGDSRGYQRKRPDYTFQERCTASVASEFPELVGTQPTQYHLEKQRRFVDTVVSGRGCIAQPVQGPGNLDAPLRFLAKRNYTTMLENYSNAILASLPPHVRDAFLTKEINRETAEHYMGVYGDEPPRDREAHTEFIKRCWNTKLVD